MADSLLFSSYSKTYLKRPLKRRPKNRFSRLIIATYRSEVLQNAPMEHSAVLLTCIKIPNSFQAFALSIIEWPLKTGFTVILLGDFN